MLAESIFVDTATVHPLTRRSGRILERALSGHCQGFEVAVPIAAGEDLREAFEAAYVRAHGRVGPDVPIEAISWRVLTRGPDPDLRLVAAPAGDGDARKGTRDVYFDDGFVATPIYDRAIGWVRARPSRVRRSSKSASPPASSARTPPPAWPRTAA